MALNVCPDCTLDCPGGVAVGPALPVFVCNSSGGDGATHGVTAELACITDDATCEVIQTVQIIKRIALADGNIDTVRIFSVDGETEIPLPLPDGQSLGPCADALPPLQFCFTDSTTEDVPGRQYDLSFDLAQGFAVEALLIDLTEFALNIAWEVTDPDASEFSADLQAAIQSQFPGATVTVTPPAITTTCGAPETFSVHIECLSLDEDPPTLVQLRYNAGRNLIQNPAYNETPPVADCDNFGDPVPGFHLIRRQDNGGTLDCTSVANRGWETNDDGETFELWCESVTTQQQVVPTPRGTPVQEINSDGNPSNNGTTIWQTFSVPAAGNFIVEMVHGARDAGETHTIRLSTGDTDDTGIGDIINNVTMPPQVTNNGGNPPNPWTVFNQTVPLPAGTFTFSLHSTSPVFQNRGGLFTDMRVYQDVPGEIADFVNNDETCTVEQTSTTTICEHWQPRACNGVIGSWRNVETNEILTDAEFWAQVPSPECCTPEVQDGGGGGGGNLMSAQLVCGIVGGIPTTLIRETIYNPSGGAIDQKFIGPDGAPLTPDDWEPGPCPADSTIPAEFILCDDNGQFIRKLYQNANGIVTNTVNITLDGTAYTPVGTVRVCSPDIVDCGEEGTDVCQANQVGGTTTYHDSSDPDGEVTVTVAGTQRTINIHFSPDPDAGNLDGNLEDWLDALDAAMTSGNVVRISFTGGTGATFPQTFVTRGSRAVSYSATNLGDESFEIVIVDDLATVDDCEGIDALYDQERSATPVTFQILDAEFSQFEEDETVTPGEETRSAMLVSVCGNIEVPFYQAICLQDSTSTQFLRVIRVDPETSLTEVIGDYVQDFSSTYVPVGATRACEASPAFVGEFILCDENGSFIRKYMQDINGNVLNLTNLTLAGQPYTPVGTVENCNTTSGNTVAEFILCDDDGSFLRKYYQDETGAVIAIVNLTLDGNPYNPVGTVNLCELSVNFTKPHFAEFILCDDNGHFLRKFRQDDTGAIVEVLNFTLEGTSYTPVGTVERCSDCCPTIIGEGCYDDGNGVERFTSIRNEDGTVTLYSQLDGSIVSPGNVVSCDVEVESTIQRLTGAGSINVPAGARSVSVTVVSGNPTVQISGGAIVTLVPGYSPTWSVVEAEETLSDSFNFVGVAGSDFYVLTTREA